MQEAGAIHRLAHRGFPSLRDHCPLLPDDQLLKIAVFKPFFFSSRGVNLIPVLAGSESFPLSCYLNCKIIKRTLRSSIRE